MNITWWFDPSYHGKGPCDGKSAVLKRTAAMYLLTGKNKLHLSALLHN